MPAEIMILAASSVVMSRIVTEARGTKQMNPGRRHDARRHEHRDHVFLATRLDGSDLAHAIAGDEDQRPQALRRELDNADLLETLVGTARGHNAFEHMLQRAVDIAHDRHALEHQFAEADERPAKEVCSQRADDRHTGNPEHQSDARNGKRQICFREVARRQPWLDPSIRDVHERPDHVERNAQWADNDETGQEVVADSRTKPPTRLIVLGKPAQPLGQLRTRYGLLGILLFGFFLRRHYLPKPTTPALKTPAPNHHCLGWNIEGRCRPAQFTITVMAARAKTKRNSWTTGDPSPCCRPTRTYGRDGCKPPAQAAAAVNLWGCKQADNRPPGPYLPVIRQSKPLDLILLHRDCGSRALANGPTWTR